MNIGFTGFDCLESAAGVAEQVVLISAVALEKVKVTAENLGCRHYWLYMLAAN